MKTHSLLAASRCVLTFIFIVNVGILTAGVPLSYYSGISGMQQAKLKAALHSRIQPSKTLSYGSGSGKTWTGFYSTDRLSNGEVCDRYSNDHRFFSKSDNASAASAVDGMNIEHSFPKSWWGGSTNNAYKDLYNLMPCEQRINSSKSNYAMGNVQNVKTDNGCTKVGTATLPDGTSHSFWEPADQWKGDFARSYMYMATAYSNLTWEGEALVMLKKDNYPTFQEWAYKLLLKWNKEDPVDEIEIARNEAVYAIQGNRNPYVDFPHLAEYVWGDSVTIDFDITTTFKAGEVVVEGGEGGNIEGGDNGGNEDIDEIEQDDTPIIDADGSLMNIIALLENCSGTNSETGTNVTFRFDNLLVTYAQGRNIFIHDGMRGYMLYGTNTLNLRKGDRISGTLTGSNYFYKTLPELNFNSMNNVKITSRNNVVAIFSENLEKLTADTKCRYISSLMRLNGMKPSNVEFSNRLLKFTDKSNCSINVYDYWNLFTTANFSTTSIDGGYDIVGLPVIYNNEVRIYVVDILKTGTLDLDDVDCNGMVSINDVVLLADKANHPTLVSKITTDDVKRVVGKVIDEN